MLLHFYTHCSLRSKCFQSNSRGNACYAGNPIAKCYLPYIVRRVEMILESYAKDYFNQFSTGNSPFQLVQCSIVPNQKKTANM